MQDFPQQSVCWLCPNCGKVTRYSLHHQHIQRQKSISIQPIFPTCVICGAEIRMHHAPAHHPDTRLIVLTGTCASGKSTTAEILVSQYGFSGIDGNCVMDVLRYKTGAARVAFNGSEMLQEIAYEIDILLALGQDIVLSHVIIPDDLPHYREMFCSRGLSYKIFVLQPSYAAAVSRSKTRTCFNTITEERWVKHFYTQMDGFAADEDVVIFDNSGLGVEESAEMILRLFQRDS